KVKVDTFVIYTDNETWAGSMHPHQALRQYREWSGIDARLVVVGLTATDFTIADPADPGMLDIAGFDAALPNLLTDFSARAIGSENPAGPRAASPGRRGARARRAPPAATRRVDPPRPGRESRTVVLQRPRCCHRLQQRTHRRDHQTPHVARNAA